MQLVNIVLVSVAIALLLLAGLEIGLRWRFGFGNPLIYIPDEQIGYLLTPNQNTRRFGNRIAINEYSMRSDPITAARPPSTLRILLLGDSIVNGGWWTDQAETIAALLQQQLQSQSPPSLPLTPHPLPLPPHPIEVLNASANSWGPRNELAYVQRFGTFAAQAVVLIINTDDLFTTVPTSLGVGRDRNYPDRKPPLALVEVFNRYVLPAPSLPELQAIQAETGDRVGLNLAAVQQLQEIAQQNQAYFLLVMTPLLRELQTQEGPRDYELQARQRLAEFTQAQGIDYLDFLPIFNTVEQPQTLYRDHIHLSSIGNQQVSEAIHQALRQGCPAELWQSAECS